MFWSYDTLEQRLASLIFDASGNPCGKKENIDCNAYTLTIGPEAFTTPYNPKPNSAKGHTKFSLKGHEQFQIPKGQFAFLLTEEVIHVPDDAMAFISFKAAFKFRGLINVSGFHVDPGYKGRLIFSLFNAGPQDATVERGEQFALIWYTDLDKKTHAKNGKKDSAIIQNLGIGTKLVNSMNGEVFSPATVQKRISELEESVRNVEAGIRKWVLILLIGIFIGMTVFIGQEWIKAKILDPIFHPEAKISNSTSLTPNVAKKAGDNPQRDIELPAPSNK